MCTYQSFGSWLWLHSTTRTVNYDSKTHVIVDSRISGSFSIAIRQVVRHFLRLTSSHCENLISQNTYLHLLQSFSRSHLVSFLLEQKFCSGYVSTALSKTIIDNWIHVLILPKIRKDTNWTRKNTSCSWLKLKLKRPKKHISVTLLTLMTMTLKVKEYRQNPDCPISLQEFGLSTSTIITKLRWPNHSIHRDCILMWLCRNHLCPTCGDNIHNPRQKKFIPKKVCLNMNGMNRFAI